MKVITLSDVSVDTYQVKTGVFVFRLYTNRTPITHIDEATGNTVTEYECDSYLTSEMAFQSKESAEIYATEHFAELVSRYSKIESRGLLLENAKEGQEFLDKTDYEVIKAMEQFLIEQGKTLKYTASRENARESVRLAKGV